MDVRTGFLAEWAIAFQEAVLHDVRTRVPELLERWPFQGVSFDAVSLGDNVVLLIHALSQRAVVAGPSKPTTREGDAGALAAPDNHLAYMTWQDAIRVNEGLTAMDHVVLIPVPANASERDCPRPEVQWDAWSDSQRGMWAMALNIALANGWTALLREQPEQPAQAGPDVPLASAVYKAHPVFEPPVDLDQPLWRYMSIAKYLDLLNRRAVHFARADLLGDPWEGRTGALNERMATELYGEHAGRIGQARSVPQAVYVSCWHAQDYESAAMWSLYTGWGMGSGEGVAVRTTFRRLVEALGGDDDVYAGLVRYIDYNTQFVAEDNVFAPFVVKRQSFEHERELRAVVVRWNESPSRGIYVPVQLEDLIEEVRVVPSAAAWLLELVATLTAALGLAFPVARSAIDDSPSP